MFNSKLKYVIAGAVICLLGLVFLSAGGGDGPEKEVGRYQISAGSNRDVFIADTKTGVVKKVKDGIWQQLGIPFDEMKND